VAELTSWGFTSLPTFRMSIRKGQLFNSA
jgi:hypothetical protein